MHASALEAGLLAPSSQHASPEAAKVAEVGGADTDDGNAHVQPFGDPALISVMRSPMRSEASSEALPHQCGVALQSSFF